MIVEISEKVNVSDRNISCGNKAQMSVWQVYESRKAALQKLDLSGKEYQAAIRELVDELGV